MQTSCVRSCRKQTRSRKFFHHTHNMSSECASGSSCACRTDVVAVDALAALSGPPAATTTATQMSSGSNSCSDDHHQSDGDHALEMERRTLSRLAGTARRRGFMDEQQRLELEATRSAFCDGFGVGVEEGRLAVLRHQRSGLGA